MTANTNQFVGRDSISGCSALLKRVAGATPELADELWEEVFQLLQGVAEQKAYSLEECAHKLHIAYALIDEADRDARAILKSAIVDLKDLASQAR